MRCITVDSPNSMYLVGEALIPTHNTRAGAEWIVERARKETGDYGVIAPTWTDVRRVCVEGPSGILACLREDELVAYNRGIGDIELRSGSVIHMGSADKPDRMRGYNLIAAWGDEYAAWRYPEALEEVLIPSVRIGYHPGICLTMTPKLTRSVQRLVRRGRDPEDRAVVMVNGSIRENQDNLSEHAVNEMYATYGGTRIGRQELEGELIEVVDGAVTTLDVIDNCRVTDEDVPDLVKIVVAVDPAVTSGEDSDMTGIVVAGKGTDGHGYVLADYTMRGTPKQWSRRVVASYRLWLADRVVAEVNNGGDLIPEVISHVDPVVPVEIVRATRGKRVRAEPVSVLYDKGSVHHVGNFPDLESQLCSWTPEQTYSPDNLDALVWAMYALGLASSGDWAQLFRPMAKAEEAKALPAPRPGSWANVYVKEPTTRGTRAARKKA